MIDLDGNRTGRWVNTGISTNVGLGMISVFDSFSWTNPMVQITKIAHAMVAAANGVGLLIFDYPLFLGAKKPKISSCMNGFYARPAGVSNRSNTYVIIAPC